MVMQVDSKVDVSGVCCPLPLIQLAKGIKDLRPGQTLEITGNDPIFEPAVRDFCEANGHAILDLRKGANQSVTVLIQVRG